MATRWERVDDRTVRRFAKNLRRVRKGAGLYQQELGEMIGEKGHWATVKISQYERGLNVPQLTTVVRIAKAIGVPVSELIE